MLIADAPEPTLQQRLEAAEADRDRYKAMAEAAQHGRMIPPYVPKLPWSVVYTVHLDGHTESSGMHYDAEGAMTPFDVRSVRIERHMGDRPRLIVNDTLVQQGSLYVDGKLHTQACYDDPSIENG
jgi:hypothetical protein